MEAVVVVLALLLGAALTWGIGLGIPWALRRWIIRRPLPIVWAALLTFVLCLVEGTIAGVIFGRASSAWVLVGIATFYILHAGYAPKDSPMTLPRRLDL